MRRGNNDLTEIISAGPNELNTYELDPPCAAPGQINEQESFVGQGISSAVHQTAHTSSATPPPMQDNDRVAGNHETVDPLAPIMEE